MGWGSITERGPNRVDHQIETNVPVVATCNPNDDQVICAGFEEGGFDSCAGKI